MTELRNTNFDLEVSKGTIPGHSVINKFGRNPDINSTRETVWDVGGSYNYLSGAEFIYVSSTSAGDTSAGVGARTIALSGLDSNYAEQSEIVIMNGLGSVKTANEYLRLNRAYVITTGGSEFNIGSINMNGSTNVVPQARISPEEGQTLMAVYTIPSGMTGFVMSYTASFDQGGAGATPALLDIDLQIHPSGGAFRVANHQGLISTGTSSRTIPFDPPIKLGSLTDVQINATSTVNNADVHAGFDVILVE